MYAFRVPGQWFSHVLRPYPSLGRVCRSGRGGTASLGGIGNTNEAGVLLREDACEGNFGLFSRVERVFDKCENSGIVVGWAWVVNRETFGSCNNLPPGR